MFEKERERCYVGIRKCDEFLKNWDVRGFKRDALKIDSYANEIPPEEVVAEFKHLKSAGFDGGGQPNSDWNVVIFYANAKLGFISRLVKMQEAEDESSLV